MRINILNSIDSLRWIKGIGGALFGFTVATVMAVRAQDYYLQSPLPKSEAEARRYDHLYPNGKMPTFTYLTTGMTLLFGAVGFAKQKTVHHSS